MGVSFTRTSEPVTGDMIVNWVTVEWRCYCSLSVTDVSLLGTVLTLLVTLALCIMLPLPNASLCRTRPSTA